MSAGSGSQISTYFRVLDGVRVRFADTRADSDTTVLMLAPWPESVWAFRQIWDRITSLGRVVAIDMPGFGHSDGRPELIAPDATGAFLGRLIDAWGQAKVLVPSVVVFSTALAGVIVAVVRSWPTPVPHVLAAVHPHAGWANITRVGRSAARANTASAGQCAPLAPAAPAVVS